jgi:hypothetical protein
LLRGCTLKLLQLRGQGLQLFFQFLEAFEKAAMGLAGGFEAAPFRAVRNELEPI